MLKPCQTHVHFSIEMLYNSNANESISPLTQYKVKAIAQSKVNATSRIKFRIVLIDSYHSE